MSYGFHTIVMLIKRHHCMEFFDNFVCVCLTAALATRLAALAALPRLLVALALATRHLGQTRKRCGFAVLHCSTLDGGFLFVWSGSDIPNYSRCTLDGRCRERIRYSSGAPGERC